MYGISNHNVLTKPTRVHYDSEVHWKGPYDARMAYDVWIVHLPASMYVGPGEGFGSPSNDAPLVRRCFCPGMATGLDRVGEILTHGWEMVKNHHKWEDRRIELTWGYAGQGHHWQHPWRNQRDSGRVGQRCWRAGQWCCPGRSWRRTEVPSRGGDGGRGASGSPLAPTIAPHPLPWYSGQKIHFLSTLGAVPCHSVCHLCDTKAGNTTEWWEIVHNLWDSSITELQ